MYRVTSIALYRRYRYNGGMTSPADRLKKLRMVAGYSSAAAAARSRGWNEVTYRAHERGAREINSRSAVMYAKAFRVTPEYILYGGQATSMSTQDVDAVAHKRPNFRIVPLLSPLEARTMPTVLKTSTCDRAVIAVNDSPDLSPHVYAILISDVSMMAISPTVDASFRPGDMVVFDRERSIFPGDYVLADIDGYPDPIFRKYQARTGGSALLVPLNSDYSSEPLAATDAHRIIGRLVRHIRNF